MDELTCEDVMRRIVLTDELTLPVPVLAAHIAGCPSCRGAFVLLAAKIVDLPSLATPISCQQCGADLAAFVEQEVEEGSASAIRTYPHVWWHLWICQDCMEIYSATYSYVTTSYVTTEQSRAWTPEIDVVVQPSKPTADIQLPRHFLNYALASSVLAQPAVRGGIGQSYILVEQDRSDSRLIVSVQRQVNDKWQVEVVYEPIPVGSVVLTFGAHSFRARFNQEGRAVVQDIPSTLLIGSEGPDLEIDIDFNAEEGYGKHKINAT